jgi:anti-anti-sigma factor
MQFTAQTLASGIRLLRPAGRLDLPGEQAINLRFTAEVNGAGASVIVDLSAVTYLSSIGLRLFFSNARSLRARGHRMILLQPTATVAEVLRLAGVDTFSPITADADEAERLAAAP